MRNTDGVVFFLVLKNLLESLLFENLPNNEQLEFVTLINVFVTLVNIVLSHWSML